VKQQQLFLHWEGVAGFHHKLTYVDCCLPADDLRRQRSELAWVESLQVLEQAKG